MAKEKILDIIKSSKVIDSAYDIKLNKGQGNNAASATRKDYVDSEIAKQVSKSGDTMTGSLITSGSLVADGVIRTKYSVETYDTSSAYGIRNNISGSSAYIQAGKVDRDVTDQKLILSGWLGTPLTMSKFSMANGVNPQVTWGSTSYDILHRGNLPNAADVGAVSKTGDRMISGNIGFSEINTGISLHPTYSSVTGFYVGSGDGATQDVTNIVLKSWYGIGIAPTAGLLPSMTMGQNSIWINARSGDINTIGFVYSNGLYLKHATSNTYTYFDAIPTKEAGIRFRNNGLDRWKLYQNITTESGGNSGSDFVLNAYSDTGSFLATAITVTRSDQVAKFLKVPIVSSAQGTEVNSLTRKDYVDGTFVAKTGDTMTGNLTVPAVNLSGSQSSAPNTVTRKDYVDGEIAKQVAKTGDTMTGVLKVNAEIQSATSNTYRQVIGNYGSMWRMDSTNAYFLLTNSGDQYGNHNALRPFSVALNTGIVTLSADSCIANSTQKIFHDKYAPRITQSEYLDTGSDLNDMVMSTGGMVVSRFGTAVANRPPVGSSANTILGFNPTGGYKHQIAFTDGGTIYSRYNNNASWSNWGKVYTDIYRPTPAEVGAVNKTGDTMTGNLVAPRFNMTGSQGTSAGDAVRYDFTEAQMPNRYQELGAGVDLDTMTTPGIYVQSQSGDISNGGLNYPSTHAGALLIHKIGTTQVQQIYTTWNTDGARRRYYRNGSGSTWSPWTTIYDTNFKPTASDVGAVAKTGDTMTGNLTVPKVLLSATQGTEVNALTRKDYVDGQVAALLARIVALESK